MNNSRSSSICNLPLLIHNPYVSEDPGRVYFVKEESEKRGHHRAVRTNPKTGLKAGAIIWVEFGASFAERQGRTFKVPGIWRQCVVLSNEVAGSPDVHVRFSEGWGSTAPWG